jgi:hypothetical protein
MIDHSVVSCPANTSSGQPTNKRRKCGATDADLMTEEDYEGGLKAMQQLVKAHAEKRMDP